MEMSAIDYAIYYKYPEAALAMVTHDERADEVMVLKSDKHPCVTLALIASMPRVFEAVQDKCITKANCKKDSKSFYVSHIYLKFQFVIAAQIAYMWKMKNSAKILCFSKNRICTSIGPIEMRVYRLSIR